MAYEGGDLKNGRLYGCVRLYGYRSKSVTAGLDYYLGCTPTLSVTTSSLMRHLWHYINEPVYFCLYLHTEWYVLYKCTHWYWHPTNMFIRQRQTVYKQWLRNKAA